MKSLPLTWIIVPLFEQLASFSVQAQTQIIIMNATCWEGLNKEQKRDELGWTHTLWSKAGNTINIHQLSCFPYTHLHISNLNARLERDGSFSRTRNSWGAVSGQLQSAEGKRDFRFPQLPLHPDFCLLAQTLPTDTGPDNELARQHTLLCQHTRFKTTLVQLRETKEVSKDVINCWRGAVAQLCTFPNTVQYLSFHPNLDSRVHTVHFFFPVCLCLASWEPGFSLQLDIEDWSLTSSPERRWWKPRFSKRSVSIV